MYLFFLWQFKHLYHWNGMGNYEFWAQFGSLLYLGVFGFKSDFKCMWTGCLGIFITQSGSNNHHWYSICSPLFKILNFPAHLEQLHFHKADVIWFFKKKKKNQKYESESYLWAVFGLFYKLLIFQSYRACVRCPLG